MKITEETIGNNFILLELKSAVYIGDFTIRIEFSDGITNLVDFKPFLQSSLHPSIRKYLDEAKFKEFRILYGNLNWNDYDMVFPIEDLYDGKL